MAKEKKQEPIWSKEFDIRRLEFCIAEHKLDQAFNKTKKYRLKFVDASIVPALQVKLDVLRADLIEYTAHI